MNVQEMLSRGKKTSKKDIVPGTFDSDTENICPACMEGKMVQLKKCCGAEKGKLYCKRCGYSIIL